MKGSEKERRGERRTERRRGKRKGEGGERERGERKERKERRVRKEGREERRGRRRERRRGKVGNGKGRVRRGKNYMPCYKHTCTHVTHPPPHTHTYTLPLTPAGSSWLPCIVNTGIDTL